MGQQRIFSYPNAAGTQIISWTVAWCYVNPVACKTTSSGKKAGITAPLTSYHQLKRQRLHPPPRRHQYYFRPVRLTQTISGCICADWSSQTGYTEKHNQCGHDKGQGTWCFVRDKPVKVGRYGFCEESKIGKEGKDRLEKIPFLNKAGAHLLCRIKH